MPYGADLANVRVSFRLSGVLLVVAGALYMSTVVVDSLRGKADGAVLTTIGAVAQLVGGSKLVAQRYPAGPDTVRRSVGILGLAIGLGILTNSLRNLLAGGAAGMDPLAILTIVGLLTGVAVVLIAAILALTDRARKADRKSVV